MRNPYTILVGKHEEICSKTWVDDIKLNFRIVCECRGELYGFGQGLVVCFLKMGFIKCGEIRETFRDTQLP
jgi:hypothetical protein